MVSAVLSSCGTNAAAPPKPPAAHSAGVALRQADDSIRSDFMNVVAENATNAGGMPCGQKCWDLTHLEKDDTGTIPNAYNAATAAYSDGTETPPAELAQWKSTINVVLADIKAWGDSADMTGGLGIHSDAAKKKTLADLDRADALVNAFAPSSIRATPSP